MWQQVLSKMILYRCFQYCTGVGMQNCPPPKGWIFLGFWDSSNALKAKQAFGFVKSETGGAVLDWLLPVPAKCLPLIANFPMRLCANKCPWINKCVLFSRSPSPVSYQLPRALSVLHPQVQVLILWISSIKQCPVSPNTVLKTVKVTK